MDARLGRVFDALARRSGSTSAPRAACRTRRGGAARPLAVPRAPVGEQPQRAGQLGARRGQLVDVARRALRVGLGDDEALAARACRRRSAEDVRRDPGDRLLEVVEAARARRAAPRRPAASSGRRRAASAAASGERSSVAAGIVGTVVSRCRYSLATRKSHPRRRRVTHVSTMHRVQEAIGAAAERVGPAVVGLRPRLGPRLAASCRATAGPHERPQPARATR